MNSINVSKIYDYMKTICAKYDNLWVTRKRKLNTFLLFKYLSNSLINDTCFRTVTLDNNYIK